MAPKKEKSTDKKSKSKDKKDKSADKTPEKKAKKSSSKDKDDGKRKSKASDGNFKFLGENMLKNILACFPPVILKILKKSLKQNLRIRNVTIPTDHLSLSFF